MYSMVFYPRWLASGEGKIETNLLRCCLSLKKKTKLSFVMIE